MDNNFPINLGLKQEEKDSKNNINLFEEFSISDNKSQSLLILSIAAHILLNSYKKD